MITPINQTHHPLCLLCMSTEEPKNTTEFRLEKIQGREFHRKVWMDYCTRDFWSDKRRLENLNKFENRQTIRTRNPTLRLQKKIS